MVIILNNYLGSICGFEAKGNEVFLAKDFIHSQRHNKRQAYCNTLFSMSPVNCCHQISAVTIQVLSVCSSIENNTGVVNEISVNRMGA